MRVPMSVGDLGELQTKKGSFAKVFDVIVNPLVIQRLFPKGPSFPDLESMGLFVNILFDYASKKHKLLITDQYKLLRKTNYKGPSIKPQRVRVTKASKIEVFNESIAQKEQLKNSVKSRILDPKSNGKIKPDWSLFVLQDDNTTEEFDGTNFGDETAGIFIQVEFPLLTTC